MDAPLLDDVFASFDFCTSSASPSTTSDNGIDQDSGDLGDVPSVPSASPQPSSPGRLEPSLASHTPSVTSTESETSNDLGHFLNTFDFSGFAAQPILSDEKAARRGTEVITVEPPQTAFGQGGNLSFPDASVLLPLEYWFGQPVTLLPAAFPLTINPLELNLGGVSGIPTASTITSELPSAPPVLAAPSRASDKRKRVEEVAPAPAPAPRRRGRPKKAAVDTISPAPSLLGFPAGEPSQPRAAKAARSKPKTVVPDKFLDSGRAQDATGMSRDQITSYASFEQMLQDVPAEHRESALELQAYIEKQRGRASDLARGSRAAGQRLKVEAPQLRARCEQLEGKVENLEGFIRSLVKSGRVSEAEARGLLA